MRGWKTIRWAVVGMILLFAVPAAATLQSDYDQIVAKRLALEAERGKHEEKVHRLEKRLGSAGANYLQCASGQWAVLWQKRMEEANEARRQLEEKNNALINLNLSLRRLNDQFVKR